MASDYPANYDELGLPGPTDKLDDPDVQHDQEHVAVAEAAMATQHALGLNPQGVYATVRARLDALVAAISGEGALADPIVREDGIGEGDEHRTTITAADIAMAVAGENSSACGGNTYDRSQGTLEAPTSVVDGDYVAFPLYARAHDGTGLVEVGLLSLKVSGTPSTGIVPVEYELKLMDDTGALWSAFRFLPTGDVLSDGQWTDITLNGPHIDGSWTSWGGNMNYPVIQALREAIATSGTGATGTINVDALDKTTLLITANAAANWTLNFRGNNDWTLDQIMNTGQAITFQVLATIGTTAYYASAIQIDGTPVTVKWADGAAPAEGIPSAINAYTFTVIKTAAATYTVLGQLGVFA
jgi:hypothetical protein